MNCILGFETPERVQLKEQRTASRKVVIVVRLRDRKSTQKKPYSLILRDNDQQPRSVRDKEMKEPGRVPDPEMPPLPIHRN